MIGELGSVSAVSLAGLRNQHKGQRLSTSDQTSIFVWSIDFHAWKFCSEPSSFDSTHIDDIPPHSILRRCLNRPRLYLDFTDELMAWFGFKSDRIHRWLVDIYLNLWRINKLKNMDLGFNWELEEFNCSELSQKKGPFPFWSISSFLLRFIPSPLHFFSLIRIGGVYFFFGHSFHFFCLGFVSISRNLLLTWVDEIYFFSLSLLFRWDI